MGKLTKEGVNSAIFIALGFLIGTIANLFIYPKVCTKEELGQFKLLLNWALIISPFIAVGAGTIAVRFYPHFKEKNRMSDLNYMLFLFPLIGILAFLVVFIPFAEFFIYNITSDLLVSLSLASFTLIMFTILQTFIKVYSGLSIALKQSSSNFFINEFLSRIILLTCFIVFYYGVVTYAGLLVLLIIAFGIQLILIIYSVRAFVFQSGFSKPGKQIRKENLNYGLYSMLDSGANMVVTRLDMLMIGIISINANANAQEYDLAINIATMVFLPWRSLVTATSPFIAESFLHNDFNKINELYKKSSINLFITGSILFILIYCNINEILKMIPGDYTMIKNCILFLGVAKLIDMLASINNVILLNSPFFRINFVFNLILIVLTISTNYFLIPILGITGSAIATAITIFLFNVMKCIFLYSKYKLVPFHQKTLTVLIGLSSIFTIGLFFPAITNSIFFDLSIRTAVLGILIYAFLHLFKPSDDLEKLRVKTFRRLKLIR